MCLKLVLNAQKPCRKFGRCGADSGSCQLRPYADVFFFFHFFGKSVKQKITCTECVGSWARHQEGQNEGVEMFVVPCHLCIFMYYLFLFFPHETGCFHGCLSHTVSLFILNSPDGKFAEAHLQSASTFTSPAHIQAQSVQVSLIGLRPDKKQYSHGV